MIYTVTLNPALDYVMRLPQLRQGEVNRAHSEEIQLGGKGINVSRVLSELGEASTALGFIAGFTGDALQQGLRAMGLHTDFVRLKRGATRINVKLKAQGETDINATGPAVDETALAALLQKLDALGPGGAGGQCARRCARRYIQTDSGPPAAPRRARCGGR